MILLLLKVTVLLGLTLALTAGMRRSSAALRHLICVCGLAASLLLLTTLVAPAGPAAFRISSLSVPSAARVARAAGGFRPDRLVWIWVAGALALMGRLGLGYWQVARLRRGLRGVVYADVSVPVLTGLFRPAILLPQSAGKWAADHLEAALRHEREHLRRGDLWSLLLSHVACAAYWFHPLAWMAAAQMRREQEQACDDAVVLSGISPASYAEALVAAARTVTSTELMGCNMVTRKSFRLRIARLLADGMPRVSSSSTLLRAAVVFAGVAITIGLVHGRAQSPDQDGAYKVGGDVSSPAILFKVDPSYSEAAREAKLEGTVRLAAHVGTDGLAHDINVISGVGEGLDEKAVEAVQKWRFRPGMKDGEAVKVKVTIEVNFKLM